CRSGRRDTRIRRNHARPELALNIVNSHRLDGLLAAPPCFSKCNKDSTRHWKLSRQGSSVSVRLPLPLHELDMSIPLGMGIQQMGDLSVESLIAQP
ncbi:hypothetical protein HaLaN_24886, partial [Haematococcus lacustris]